MTLRLFDVIHTLRVLREKSPHGVYIVGKLPGNDISGSVITGNYQ